MKYFLVLLSLCMLCEGLVSSDLSALEDEEPVDDGTPDVAPVDGRVDAPTDSPVDAPSDVPVDAPTDSGIPQAVPVDNAVPEDKQPVEVVPSDDEPPVDAPAVTDEPAIPTFAPTPQPTPGPTPEPTNAPSSVPTQASTPAPTGQPSSATPAPTNILDTYISWCDKDSDCRGWGDNEATCNFGGCNCSTGFAHPSATAKVCTVPADFQRFLTRKVRARVDAVYLAGDCQRFEGLQSAFESIWRERLGSAVVKGAYGCGSVYAAVTGEVTNSVVASGSTVVDQVAADVASDSGMAAALGGHALVRITTGSGLMGCESTGAIVSADLNGVCKALTCEHGYDLVTGTNTAVCKKQESSSSSSGSTIIIIIIGAAVALLALLSCVYCSRRKRSKHFDEDSTEMEPHDPSRSV